MPRNTRSGYVGLLMLLVVTTIIVLIFAKTYFTPRIDTANQTAPSITPYDQLRTDVTTAKSVIDTQNKKAQETNQMLNNF